MTTAEALPDDIAGTARAVAALVARARRTLMPSSRCLRHHPEGLQRARFGRRSERLDPDQLQLALEEIEQALAQAEARSKSVLHCAVPEPRARTSANPSPHICHASRS